MPAGTTQIQSSYTSAYISPETFLNARDIRREIFDKYNERNLLDMLWHSGYKMITDRTRFNWFEHDFLYSYFQIASSTGTPGAGNPVTITVKVITPAETEGPGSWAVAAYTVSPGKKTDTVMVGDVRGWISATDKTTDGAHTYTISPVDVNDDIVTATVDDDYVALFSNAKADGTTQPESMVRKPILYYNTTQIFANNYTSYGSEAANKSEVVVKGKPYYYLQGVEDASLKHMLDMEFAFIMGKRSDSLVDASFNNEAVNTTGGLDWFIDTFGNNLTYTSGSFDYDDLETIEKSLSANRAARHVLQLNGIDVNIEIDDAVKGKLDAGGSSAVDWSKFGDGDGAKRAIDWGIDGFRFSNRNYYKKEMEFLNYKPITGNPTLSASWPGYSYTIPLGTIKNPRPMGAYDEYFDTISIRYKANDRGARFIEHWVRDHKITNDDQIEFNYRSEAGLMFVGASQAVSKKPA